LLAASAVLLFSAAGFVLEAQSDALRNPADTQALVVFAPSIRGKIDQFMPRSRKPKG
jgi:predicted methyltransferase